MRILSLTNNETIEIGSGIRISVISVGEDEDKVWLGVETPMETWQAYWKRSKQSLSEGIASQSGLPTGIDDPDAG